jgi:hypothetical protein
VSVHQGKAFRYARVNAKPGKGGHVSYYIFIPIDIVRELQLSANDMLKCFATEVEGRKGFACVKLE